VLVTVAAVAVAALQFGQLWQTNDINRAIYRAFAYFGDFGHRRFDFETGSAMGISVRITNSGNVPITDLEVSIDCYTRVPSPEQFDPFSRFNWETNREMAGVLGPHQEVNEEVCSNTLSEIADVAKGKLQLYGVGEMRYSDSFDRGRLHVVRFAKLFSFSGTEQHLNMQAFSRGKNNCADEQCAGYAVLIAEAADRRDSPKTARPIMDWSLVAALGAVATALFAGLTWIAYRNIEFFTGSMESHSTAELKIKIEEYNSRQTSEDAKIRIQWLDKSIHGKPSPRPKDGEPIDTKTVYFSVPRGDRKIPPTIWGDLWNTACSLCTYIFGNWCRRSPR
jgi:hypothetical protein